MYFLNNTTYCYFYFFISIIGGFLGFSLSAMLRVELNSSFLVFGNDFYYIFLTGHGVVMVFYFLTILSSGFYSLLLPNMCFLSSMIFNYLSFLSVFLSIISFIFLIFSLFFGLSISTGWTLYVPLSSNKFSIGLGLDFAIFSLFIFSIYLILNSINILSTFFYSFLYIFNSIFEIPIFIWSSALSSFLILFSTPFFICVIIMLLSDRIFNTYYFDCEYGGSIILFQSLFWFWGHPEVYVLIIPIFGAVSQSLKIILDGRFYNNKGVIFSLISLSILSFLVWGHHMSTVGWASDIKGFFMVATVIISIPTGVKVFSWVYNLFLVKKEFDIAIFSLILFILIFSFGGVTGVFLSNYSLDLFFHDSYMVLGHFHVILVNGALLGYFSLFFLYFKSILITSSIKYYILIVFFSLFFIFLLELIIYFHLLGGLNIPRRVTCYYLDYYLIFHFLSISFLGIWFGVVLFVFLNMHSIVVSLLNSFDYITLYSLRLYIFLDLYFNSFEGPISKIDEGKSLFFKKVITKEGNTIREFLYGALNLEDYNYWVDGKRISFYSVESGEIINIKILDLDSNIKMLEGSYLVDGYNEGFYLLGGGWVQYFVDFEDCRDIRVYVCGLDSVVRIYFRLYDDEGI